MCRLNRIPFLAVVSATALALFFWGQSRSHKSAEEKRAIPGALHPEPEKPAPIEQVEIEPVPQTTAERLESFRGRLANEAAANRKTLAELRAFLDALPRQAATSELQAFLASGKDAVTRLDVTIKSGGALGDASSLRVFLLDYLGQVDPAAAGKLAKQTLSVSASPDEWAVSLRNYAWSDSTPAGMEYLRGKASELISNAGWQQNPSSGYLEAFDAIVYARGFELAPKLAELVRNKENRAVAHAAYLTLDRLTISDPAAALATLATQPELMEGREQTRANFFARADVREAPQKALLETYLLDPSRSPLELQTFAGIYPNGNYMISNNLLSPTPTPTQPELAAGDRAALGAVKEWLADPRFNKLQPHLKIIQGRLQTFVQQAAASSNPKNP